MQSFDTKDVISARFIAFFQSMEVGEVGVVLVNVQNFVGVEPNSEDVLVINHQCLMVAVLVMDHQ